VEPGRARTVDHDRVARLHLPGGPKLVCVDLTRDEVVQTILFPPDVALPTTYLNDVRFDLRRGEAGAAFITDSSDQGPNGIVVVDIATGKSWRRLHEHPSTKVETRPDLRMIVEGVEIPGAGRGRLGER